MAILKYADLHIHSSYSDGNITPEDIIKTAKDKGIKCISITDHDTIDSQYITREKIDGLKIIPGIEFSTEYEDLELHILGYFIDIDNERLNNTINKLKKSRLNRGKKIIEKLQLQDIAITLDDVELRNSSTLSRSHIANAIVSKGYEENYKEAFTNYLVKGKAAYVRGDKLHYKEVIEVINEAGGVAVLAHPGKIYRSMEVESVIRKLKCCGLRGVEVYHPSHTSKQINYFYNLCKKHKLCITGGSDYHGIITKEVFLGSQGVNEILLNKLINIK
ncbi:MAG: PHP domain-containing protein [Clostridium sp.]